MIKLSINTFSFISIFTFVCILIMSLGACVDLEFDTPPAGGFDPNLPVNTTIAELKAMHTLDAFEEITEDIIIYGIVISNDEAGNFFKQLVIQDSTGGIELRIDMSDLHNFYPVGRKVYVKAKGLWLGDYNGLIQLGAGRDAVTDDLLRIPESIIDKVIVPATFGNIISPKTISINQLKLSDVSTLVKIEGVQFVAADAGKTWADAVFKEEVNLFLEDCNERNIIVRSSGFASFAGEPTPQGNGSITAVLGIFGSTYQLMIRDLSDVAMTGTRCNVTSTTTIDESFDSVDDDDDIFLPGWSNIAVKGSRVWRGQVFMGDHYAQATAFGDSSPEMETWLITPGIDLSSSKKLTFESAVDHYVHDGLTVWVSSNFNGLNVTSATWTQLSPQLAGQANDDFEYVPSGIVDLSGHTGTVHIGFKYVGSGPGGETTTYIIDKVRVENL